MSLLNLARKDGSLDLSKLDLTKYYFRNESYLRFIICCIKRSEKELQEQTLIEKGSEQLICDFNYRNLLDRLRLS